jgi:prolactin regulatory element-binding protein
MDSAYLASTAEDSACRVWEIAKGESIAQLQREKVCPAFMDIEQLSSQSCNSKKNNLSLSLFLFLWQDERFGYCRFSRDGTQAFLFVSITKGKVCGQM